MTQDTSDAILERMMALHPKIIDLTLDRMWRLLERLGNPQEHLPPVVHIAGTNGKGSTLAMIRAGLEGAGHSVHAYTSPHIERFHERIRLAGQLINEATLTAKLDECYERNGGKEITYFEITTCAALLAFSRTEADYVLLEVGLGGRLDATNVIEKPRLCAITPVAMDHESFLGETLDKIAFEKAGILKRGVPCVVAKQSELAEEVIEAQSARSGAPLLVAGQHWHVSEDAGRLAFQDEQGMLDLPLPNLRGPHQIENAGTALAVLRQLGIAPQACEAAVTTARWPARMERLTKGALAEACAATGGTLWLDGGHNPAAGQALARTVEPLLGKVHLICGMLRTKDATGYLKALAPISQSLHAISIPNETATFTAEETAQMAKSAGHDAQAASDVRAALEEILASNPGAHVVICGSLYLAGHVMREFGH